jgi:cephamycin C biosynthesis protein
MSTVSTLLCYGAPLVPSGPDDDWLIDGVSRSPELILNFRLVAVKTVVTDLRDGKIHPRLDDMGFEKLQFPTRVDQRALLQRQVSSLEQYQAETGALLKSLTIADAVLFFDTTLRREHTDIARIPPIQPAHLRVHVDQNPRSALARAINHGGPERQFRRFQIINVWRPLIEPVRNFPLALCDYRSVDLSADLVSTRLNFASGLKDRENYSLKSNSNHRWYYWKSLSPHEVIVFKCYDSASRDLSIVSDGTERSGSINVAGLCPHTAFFDENGPKTGHLRTSLEMRALLFYD